MKAIIKRILCCIGIHDWKYVVIGPVDILLRCMVCRKKKRVKPI